ncbi:MAG: formate dehydrogenase accessory protein FdhE [Dokdonella sp.]
MAQRILEPGQIETLAQRSIARVRLPNREQVFACRAERLRHLAEGHALGDYLRLMATLVDAQQAALDGFDTLLPSTAQIEQAREYKMPPLLATGWPRDPQWHGVVRELAAAVAARPGTPAGVAALVARLREASSTWLEAQAETLLALQSGSIDIATAPFVMAALQVHWVALTAAFVADRVETLDVPGVCPLCGTLPVASLVAAQSPYTGYRYLHCALCASEWHSVRVQCTNCGANGKDIGYQSLSRADVGHDASESSALAVRAESCDACHSYRKILYQEKDPAIEPVADDLASLALDLLLGESGYHRASGNPLLWQVAED